MGIAAYYLSLARSFMRTLLKRGSSHGLDTDRVECNDISSSALAK